MKSFLILSAILIFSSCEIRSSLLEPGETLVYSFETVNGKTMILAEDTVAKSLVYRYGTDEHVELEFPSTKENSYSKFGYASYIRGGGPENDGMDLNYIQFDNGGFVYRICDEYYSTGNSHKVWIRVSNKHSGEVTEIKGIESSVKGTLADFRFNEKLQEFDLE